MIVSQSSTVAGLISNVCSTQASNCLFARVIAFAGLYFPVFVVGLDFDFPESTVSSGVGGCVADGILAAHLVLKFAECVLECHLPVDVEIMPTGLLGHAPKLRIAHPSKHHSMPVVEGPINIVEPV